MANRTYEIFAKGTPHYVISTAGDIYAAKQEALRLEKRSGLRGAFMIRECRAGKEPVTYPAFLSA